MLFKRKLYDVLVNWKKENGKTALLIEGARRIGKTTLVETFGKQAYKSCIIIDFAKANPQIHEYFETLLDDLDTFFMLLSATYKTPLYPRDSLIVFDEVQRFPRAREAIKYLVKDGRYDYIETGSLISIQENVANIVLPSEERSVKMYPLDYEEFCTALGEEQLLPCIYHAFQTQTPLPTPLHQKAMRLFRLYLLLGGMPMSVAAFLESERNFLFADKEKRAILNLYREDIRKIRASLCEKVITVYDHVPTLLSQHDKKVNYQDLEQSARANQYDAAFTWLSDAMLVNICMGCLDPNVGFALTKKQGQLKCYFGDTGLLLSHTFSERELTDDHLYQQLLLDKLSINEGMFYENIIAQMLTAKGHKLYFYKHYNPELHRSDMEIDFILTNESKLKYKIFPIEVKSSNTYSTKSLTRFIEKFKSRIGGAYIIHPKNLTQKEEILCIPPYMTICL